MAVYARDNDGNRGAMLFPSHDPDLLDEGLALEMAIDQSVAALVAAVRAERDYLMSVVDENDDGGRRAIYEQRVFDALDAYDAAVKANSEHDSYAK
jgi:hypothetical protein